MKDFSRMFDSLPAASEGKTKMPDYSKMFNQQAAVVGHSSPFRNAGEIIVWRRDLSEKVREHIDLIDKIVQQDVNVIANAEKTLSDISNEVADHVEKSSSKWLKFFSSAPSSDLDGKVRTELGKLELELKHHLKADPFKLREVDQMLGQASYLHEQLAKAGAELEKIKPLCKDDIEVDAINRRCATLYKQQQLIAMGVDQIKKLAFEIRARPQQVDDLLNSTIPMCRKLCLDVLSGTKQVRELRNK